MYEIVNRDGRKTSFAYRLEVPQEPGEVQDELQIKKEASFTLSMKVNVPYMWTARLLCFIRKSLYIATCQGRYKGIPAASLHNMQCLP